MRSFLTLYHQSTQTCFNKALVPDSAQLFHISIVTPLNIPYFPKHYTTKFKTSCFNVQGSCDIWRIGVKITIVVLKFEYVHVCFIIQFVVWVGRLHPDSLDIDCTGRVHQSLVQSCTRPANSSKEICKCNFPFLCIQDYHCIFE